MRRVILSLVVSGLVLAAYYAGAQQPKPGQYTDLRAAWERVKGQYGQFTPYDEQLLSFNVREDGVLLVESVGPDHVVFHLKDSSLIRVLPISQMSLNFDRP